MFNTVGKVIEYIHFLLMRSGLFSQNAPQLVCNRRWPKVELVSNLPRHGFDMVSELLINILMYKSSGSGWDNILLS